MSLDDDGGHRRPRWVTAAAVVAVVLVVLLVVLWVSGGSHGPGRHVSSDGSQRALPLALPADG